MSEPPRRLQQCSGRSSSPTSSDRTERQAAAGDRPGRTRIEPPRHRSRCTGVTGRASKRRAGHALREPLARFAARRHRHATAIGPRPTPRLLAWEGIVDANRARPADVAPARRNSGPCGDPSPVGGPPRSEADSRGRCGDPPPKDPDAGVPVCLSHHRVRCLGHVGEILLGKRHCPVIERDRTRHLRSPLPDRTIDHIGIRFGSRRPGVLRRISRPYCGLHAWFELETDKPPWASRRARLAVALLQASNRHLLTPQPVSLPTCCSAHEGRVVRGDRDDHHPLRNGPSAARAGADG